MDYLNELVFLLNEQMYGKKELINKIRRMIKPLFSEQVFRDESLTSAQISVIETIMKEWEGMFSFKPGRLEGIPFIISLLDWLKYKQTVDNLDIYKKEEWVKIVELRGPVESVLEEECQSCHTSYYAMGLSGFLDISSYVCSSCGNVYFKSVYLDNCKVPICDCGGTYTIGCPNCSEQSSRIVHEISPYEYFQKHKYIRGEGA